MDVSKYNIAIVGTGLITKTHINVLKSIPELTIAGIYGKDYTRTEKIAHTLGVKAFRDYQEILSNPNIQVVDISTSSNLHADYGIEAAKHSKNLIIEKPLDVSFEKASELVRLSREKGILLGAIYQRRFDESSILLKKLIDKNIFGKPISGKVICRPRRDLEYYQSAHDGCKGVLINYGIHYIDLITYLLGEEPSSSWGIVRKTRPGLEVEDYASLTLEFKDSFLFTIDISTNVKKSLPTVMEIHGEKGSVVFWGEKIKFTSLDMQLRELPWTTSYLKLYMARRYKIPFRFYSGSHEDVFRNYLDALEGKAAVCVDGSGALASLKVVCDIYNNQQSNDY